jgi:spermidine synthase
VLRQQLMRGDIGMAQLADNDVDPAPEPESGWALEQLAPHARFGYRATSLQTLQTPYQKLELLQTPQFGKVLRLDDRFMTSEGESSSITRPWCTRPPWPTRAAQGLDSGRRRRWCRGGIAQASEHRARGAG